MTKIRTNIDIYNDVIDALSRKKGGISRTFKSIDIILILPDDEVGDHKLRVEFFISPRLCRCSFVIEIWSDRWIWLNLRKSSADYSEFNIQGRLLSQPFAQELISLVEKSASIVISRADKFQNELGLLWGGNLASGPKKE